jgi:hypothetical protein
MKKFSAGGAQGRYEHRMKDIEKDRKIALAKGKNADVVEAKAAQRKADAEDDRAKRMGTDRTATRKAEYDAEQRLSRTRRFGADKPAAAAEPAKTPAPAATPEAAKDKPKSFGAAFKEARARLGAGKTFTFNGKSYTTNIAGENRKASTSGGTGTADASKADAPKVNYRNINFGKPSTSGAATGTPALIARNASSDAQAAKAAKPNDTPKAAQAPKRYETPAQAAARVAKLTGSAERRNNLAGMFGIDSVSNAKARAQLLAVREKEKARNAERAKGNSPTISGTDTDAFITFGDAAAKKNAANKAKGGKVKKKEKVMKYAKGGSTPPQPTPADRARSKKHLDELKKLKPTDAEGKAVGSANRSSGYAKGGKVKKMAVGGMAPNTAGGTVTGATPGNTQTGVPSAPAANTAGGTVTRATPGNTQTGVPSPSAPAPYKPVTPLQNVQNFIDRKYSSATPNLDKSARANTTTGVVTPTNFDRNQSSRDFNSVARTFINQGVPQKAVVQAQGELRKLQMDNSSTPAQHQAAIQGILARMKGLIPSKGAGAGAIKGPGGGFAKGGSMKAANKSGRALVKKSADTEGRAMKKFASGGLVGKHKAANGIAKKGLTKGTQVKMNKGGACYAKGGSVRSIDGIATKGKTRCKGARK